MTDETDQTRVYGMPDDANRQPPPAQGMRGEQANEGANLTTDLTHEERIDGRDIKVRESSGVAFAEASGAVARNQARLAEEDAENAEDKPTHDRPAG